MALLHSCRAAASGGLEARAKEVLGTPDEQDPQHKALQRPFNVFGDIALPVLTVWYPYASCISASNAAVRPRHKAGPGAGSAALKTSRGFKPDSKPFKSHFTALQTRHQQRDIKGKRCVPCGPAVALTQIKCVN